MKRFIELAYPILNIVLLCAAFFVWGRVFGWIEGWSDGIKFRPELEKVAKDAYDKAYKEELAKRRVPQD
jgi:hypothetical protein